jgi:penicillin-insensitive murein DD-endopeptidase
MMIHQLRPSALFILYSFCVSCQTVVTTEVSKEISIDTVEVVTPIISTLVSPEIEKYMLEHPDDSEKSKTKGTVSSGSLENGKLVPFSGSNFTYFDEESYLAGRAFTHHKVKKTLLNAYTKMESLAPNRHFYLMEMSNQEGGKLFPHRTHQNGMSVDFMMPKLKNNEPYYGLDSLGKEHYMLSFTDKGQYSEDSTVIIDFDLMALHILQINEAAKKEGLTINKVIVKIEYKEHLFATPNGKKLKSSGIYIVKGLTPIINYLHDDHYHIDFE